MKAIGDVIKGDLLTLTDGGKVVEVLCSTEGCENTVETIVIVGIQARAYCPECRSKGLDRDAEAVHSACGGMRTYYHDPYTNVGFYRCDRCFERWLETAPNEVKPNYIQAQRAFAAMCPQEYRKAIDRKLLADPKAFDRVLSWRRGNRSLILYGQSQTAKTRAAFALLRSLMVGGERAKVFLPNEFTTQAAEHAASGDIGRWIRSLVEYGIILFDDLGKENFTEHSESRFFQLLESLISNGKPFIITTNAVGATLKAKFVDKNTALALMGRLENNCDAIEFKRGGR